MVYTILFKYHHCLLDIIELPDVTSCDFQYPLNIALAISIHDYVVHDNL